MLLVLLFISFSMKRTSLIHLFVSASFLFASPVLAVDWQVPDNYTRTPSSTTPENPITISVDFDNDSCPTQIYRYWAFDNDGSPVFPVGATTTLQGGTLSQTMNFPSGTAIDAVRLVCTNADGIGGLEWSDALEAGSPAFTSTGTSTFSLVSWEQPTNYTRTPAGGNPANPLTLSARFNDRTGCTSRKFRFWIFDDEGNPVAGIGEPTGLFYGVLTQTANLPGDIPVEAIRLACVEEDGDYIDSGDTLEAGSPAFTPYQSVLFVAGGGTGATSYTTNGVLIGNGTQPLQITAAGSANQIFRVSGSGGAPSFGALDLSQSAAVTGTLPVLFGGTGVATAFTQGSLIFAGASGVYSQNNSALFWDNATSRLGIGTASPSNKLTVVGTIAGTHLKGLGGAPSIAAGSGAGTGGSASIVGNDTAGEVTVVAGTLPSGSATIATVTFGSNYGSSPFVVFSPSNPTAGLLSGLTGVHVTSTSSTLQFVSGTTGIGAGTFKWTYHVIE